MVTRRETLKLLGMMAGGLATGAFPQLAQVANAQTGGRPLMLAHFMPWYQAPSVSGAWGWHWTMDHFDPEKNEVASHFMPLTGPYDSSDDAILEYQVLLMKLSGIDGVIVDWYGLEDFRDYAACHRSTAKLFDLIKKAGMTFSICYEDQSLKHMETEGLITREEAFTKGQEVMRFMEENWFKEDAYLKFNDQPVLLIFGPQYFKSSGDWDRLFSVLDPSAVLVTLDKHMVTNALASFPWPPMQGYTITPELLEKHLTQFYRKAKRWDYIVGGAFPGFYDIYYEAGVRASYGFLDAQGDKTFRNTLQMAIDQNPQVIQLITWNDYGEGTIIEPTEEFGHLYLEIMQETQRSLQPNFPFTAEDLALPMQLLQLRQAGDDSQQEALNGVFEAVVAGDLTTARDILAAQSAN